MKNISLLTFTSLFLIACGGDGTTTAPDTNNSRELQSATQTETENPTTKPQDDPIMITPDTEEPTTKTRNPEQTALLKVHNDARVAVGISQQLTWSDTIAVDAQSYADTLAESGAWEHDPKNHGGYTNGPYGENLYTAYSSSGKIPSWEKAALSWVDEKAFYHYGVSGDKSTCDTGKSCGHYTQIIWENTTQVGCATSLYKKGSYKGWYLIVCKYKTPGNYRGETPY